MAKPTIIKDKFSIFVGILGLVGVVFNLWRAVFNINRNSFELFTYLLLTVFATVFFSWLIFSNIRFPKKDKNKEAKGK